jgi:hypothetical protein
VPHEQRVDVLVDDVPVERPCRAQVITELEVAQVFVGVRELADRTRSSIDRRRRHDLLDVAERPVHEFRAEPVGGVDVCGDVVRSVNRVWHVKKLVLGPSVIPEPTLGSPARGT